MKRLRTQAWQTVDPLCVESLQLVRGKAVDPHPETTIVRLDRSSDLIAQTG